ncbi:DivIVA domain-containing protein, partial [Isoptericola cucumis]
MALLTAEDILNKKFSATKFREGYDVEEVDDFLDEVVRTLTSVQEENEDLRSKLAAAERRVGELSRSDAAQQSQPSAPTPA